MIIQNRSHHNAAASLWTLLHPRGQMPLFVGFLFLGVLTAWLSVTRLSMPLWSGVVVVLALLAYPAVRKWCADYERLGLPVTVLSILLATQSFHTVEHIAQWVQYYILAYPLQESSGLISPLNAEIVHFGWNVGVLLVVIYLIDSGMRNGWMWLLLLWAGAHTAEHTYMFVTYLQEVQWLTSSGASISAAQGLPGVLGKGGWLANNAATSGPIAFLCTFAPGLANAPRLDVHFWWNVGEIALLLPAAHSGIRETIVQGDERASREL
ncbi:hypothetical protein HC891_28130 [Candidatus Gracilibacteria bacterium]|nr:hypothetical protein [Candidatus Gracilibacteria bacterium]